MKMKAHWPIGLTILIGLAVLPARVEAQEGKPPIKIPLQENTGLYHEAEHGETLWSIAEKYYGNGYLWTKLEEFNRGSVSDPNRLDPGQVIYIPDPGKNSVNNSGIFMNPGSAGPLVDWIPNLRNFNIFGRSVYQILAIVLTWFLTHFSIQAVFVWFAAHLAFIKDVSMKKAMQVSLQSEVLAFGCIFLVVFVGMMILYVNTHSPGTPLSSDMFGSAEQFLGSRSGIAIVGVLLVLLYGFLGLRFIPQAFGAQGARGVAVVLFAILIPHVLGVYLVGHRLGFIG